MFYLYLHMRLTASNITDTHLFDIVDPKHPCSGGLSIEDVQRRLAQQVAELHLDERFQSGREVIGKHFASGQKKVSTAFNNVWADIEAMREAQRRRHEESKAAEREREEKGEKTESRNSGAYKRECVFGFRHSLEKFRVFPPSSHADTIRS
jgi:hypothetical protein